MNKSRIPSLYLLTLLLLFVLPGLTASAQQQTNTQALQKTSQQLAAHYQSFRKILLQTAKEKGWPLTLRSKKGRLAYLRGVNSQGLPYYVTTTDNIISAATIRTTSLWSGGALGLNLNGSSSFLKGRIAVWDEGLVRPTHVELVGRVKQEDAAQGDTILSDHSTHVSGTMIAQGVNPVAKGMSFGAQLLQAYDFNNDESEMAAAAAGTNGIIVSNHSYADIAGWYLDASENNRWEFWGNPGDTVDYKFGLYDQDTQIWDSIAYNAPYYLIAKAGGNNPGDTGAIVGQPYWRMNAQGTFINAGNRPAGISSNTGYETIATYGNAKNILTLGAVNPIPGGYNTPSDVVQAYFSSLGPTGDGRIKPDVVADGVNVLSSISTADNAYDIYSGTSMATPATAGSSFLLQEYYGKLHHDSLMRSATLRGLIIHTADEAGNNPGPDYTFGWGLVDIEKAAAVITADNTDQSQQIIQSSLSNSGATDSAIYVVTASGKIPVSATICWTDPPGVPINIPLNSHNFADTSIKLINDLDLRIRDNTTNKVYMPWILDPKHPGNAATKGDNIRDNVEKVELGDSLIPGRNYTITVNHKRTLQRGTQAYSLLISGVGTSYCPSASLAGSNGTAVTNLTINSIADYTNASPCPNPLHYMDSSGGNAIQLAIGQTYPLSFSFQNCSGTFPMTNMAVYIDANSNDTFESNELVYSHTGLTGGSTTGSFTVPLTAKPGAYARMRILFEDSSAAGTPQPCDNNYSSGQTLDFRVAFVSPPNDVGVTALEYPTPTTCANDSQVVSIHIHNFGTAAQTGGIPVTTVVTGGSSPITLSATCLDSIPPGGDVIFTYNTFFPSIAGTTYTFFSKTALLTDPNTANDTSSASITVNAAEAAGTGAATLCGANATSVVLHANASGDDLALWYDSPTATTPIAAGNNTTTTEITANKTYYLGLNDLQSKAGPSGMNASALAASSSAKIGGAYFRFGGNFMKFTTYVPLTIESAKMYIGHTGQIQFMLAQLISFNDNTGEYQYLPITTSTVDVYPTMPNYNSHDTAIQISEAPGYNTDAGAYFLLNIPVPNPGDYILMFNTANYASAFLNANIKTNPYPLTLPGVMSITGNDMIDVGKADSITQMESFYYPLYDIGLRLEGCPSSARTAITATTSGNAPTITQQGLVFVSSVAAGNQWYLNDSLLTDSTNQQIQPRYPGVYYSTVYDPQTGCSLQSNSLVYTPNTGDPNARIGLRVWPNPGPGWANVMFYMSNSADLSIALFDMLGNKVYQKDYGTFSGSFNDKLTTTLAAGIYEMKIYHGSDTYIYKIAVRH
jgi:Subtilase family/GEVED domain/Secretion system C-terminal sorting domain